MAKHLKRQVAATLPILDWRVALANRRRPPGQRKARRRASHPAVALRGGRVLWAWRRYPSYRKAGERAAYSRPGELQGNRSARREIERVVQAAAAIDRPPGDMQRPRAGRNWPRNDVARQRDCGGRRAWT